MSDNFRYADQHGEPISGDPDVKVTRQTGLPPEAPAAVDPTPLRSVVQGSPDIFTTRNAGNGAQRFGRDGTLYTDSRAEDGTLYTDTPTIATGEANPPPAPAPAIAASDLPLPGRLTTFDPPAAAVAPPSVPQVAGVVQADQPGTAGTDPRDSGGAPTIITPEAIAAAKAAAKK